MPISSSRLPLRALWVLPALYLLGLICVALWPTPVDASARGALDSVLAWLHSVGVPNFVGYDLVEFGANIALFIPLGLLMGFGLRRFWLAVGFGVLATSLIEASQWLFLPQRFASGFDILANSSGALLGALCWLFWSRSRRKVRADGQGSAPIGGQSQ